MEVYEEALRDCLTVRMVVNYDVDGADYITRLLSQMIDNRCYLQ